MGATSEAARARARDLRLRRTYGITAEDYGRMFEAQEGRCAICGTEPKGMPLNVDHDHKSGLVRGLLCWFCNHKTLPGLRDDPCRAQRAHEYLKNPPALKVVGEVIAPAKPKRRRRRKKKT